jgi:hypothetical protein
MTERTIFEVNACYGIGDGTHSDALFATKGQARIFIQKQLVPLITKYHSPQYIKWDMPQLTIEDNDLWTSSFSGGARIELVPRILHEV